MSIDKMKININEIVNAVVMDMHIGVNMPDNYNHYTSIPSFLNIIESGELWFSHFNFLNDPNEVSFGLDVLNQILKKSKISEILDDDFFNKLKNLKLLKQDHIFIFSLSQEADSLSQWMSYGDNGSGVSISFNRNPMSLIRVSSKMYQKVFFPVLYYRDINWYDEFYLKNDRLNHFEDNLIIIFDLIFDRVHTRTNDEEILNLFADYILLFSSCIKNDFYENENEYRLILKVPSDDNSIYTQAYENSLKIHYRTDIKNGIGSLIEKIIIGPKHYGDERIKYGLENALRKKELGAIEVVPSSGIMQ